MDCPHCVALRREVLELKEELTLERKRWRSDEDTVAHAQKIIEIRAKMYNAGVPVAKLRPGVIRTWLELLSHPGQIKTNTRLIYTVSMTGDASPDLIKTYVSYARAGFDKLGIPNAIELVHGIGYFISPQKAAEIKAVFPEILGS